MPPNVLPMRSSSGASSKKRAHKDDTGSPKKLQKTESSQESNSASGMSIQSYFSGNVGSKPTPSLIWEQSGSSTCLVGKHLEPACHPKVAAFDLDGTLIQTKSGHTFAKSSEDWKWWTGGSSDSFSDVVPKRLKQLHRDGYTIVIISNQKVPGSFKDPKKIRARLDQWKNKVQLIAYKIPNVPFHVFAATAGDMYRKPMLGMWYKLEEIYKQAGVQIDLKSSFYVGDAAGRPNDHHVTDRLFATNAGLPFHTPEPFFLGQKELAFENPHFHPSSLNLDDDIPLYVPTSSPLVPAQPPRIPEVVLFVGFPSSGKSSLYKRYFQPIGYVHINQDKLKTREKCVKMVERTLDERKSCVVDNTNRDIATRAEYINVARDCGATIRVLHFLAPLSLAYHNNLYRGLYLTEEAKEREEERSVLPWSAFATYKQGFQEPTMSEGFREIKKISWLWDGTAEDFKRWNQFLVL